MGAMYLVTDNSEYMGHSVNFSMLAVELNKVHSLTTTRLDEIAKIKGMMYSTYIDR